MRTAMRGDMRDRVEYECHKENFVFEIFALLGCYAASAVA